MCWDLDVTYIKYILNKRRTFLCPALRSVFLFIAPITAFWERVLVVMEARAEENRLFLTTDRSPSSEARRSLFF